jgi:tetratricopeptide (TPR) repeat protein
MAKPFSLLAVSLFLGLAFLVQGIGQDRPSAAPKGPTGDPSQEAAIIEELHTSARFENDGSSQQTVRQRAKIQNEAGLKQYGIITFNFTVGQEFSIDTVEVRKKDGSTIKAGPDNVQEVTPEVSRVAPMYSDLHQKQVTVPGLAVGDEVLFQYSAKQAALVPNQFWFQHAFTNDAIVLDESVEINVPKQRKLHINYQPDHKPVVQDNGDRTVYTWHGSNQRLEDAEMSRYTRRRAALTGTAPPLSIELSTFESWEQVGAWYYQLQRERSTPTPAIKTKALELTRGMTTQEAKIKALYQFVSSNFRYISLDFGIGRYQPHAAEQVLTNGYGDCKDKHTLLEALLEAVGIPAQPALISIHRQVDTAVPSPAQFDHLITAVPSGKETVFLDTTAEVAPYGLLLTPLRHKQALVVGDQASSRFVETPANPPFPVQEVFDFNGKIDDSGTMEADVSLFFHGDGEVLFKSAFRETAPSKHKDIVQLIARGMGFAGEVSEVKIAGLQDAESGLRISYHYHRAEFFDLGAYPPKNSLPLGIMLHAPWDEKDPSFFLYTSPGELTYRCKVELPEGVTAEPPLPIKLERDYVRYVSTYSSEKNVLTGEKKMTVLVPEVNQSHRQDFEAFRRAMQTDEGQEIMLRLPAGFVARSKTGATTDVDELMRQAEIEARQQNNEAALADFRKVADRDPKHKGVWTQIGLVENHLRRYNQAVKDFQKAIEVDSFDAQAHAELGAAYLATQYNEPALAELRKAEEIDPLNHRAHYLLAWHFMLHTKDYASAAPELETALATDSTWMGDEGQIRDMLATAYFKLNQPDKGAEALRRRVEASPGPATWNNAAYTLAENGYQLDLARQYARSALKALYQQLSDVPQDVIRSTDLGNVALLANTWDTMAWIDFKSGDAESAEKFARSAWVLGQSHTAGEHLGEIYEKLGRRQEAMRYYAMSTQYSFGGKVAGNDPAGLKLVKMVGETAAAALVREYSGEPPKLRTLRLGNIAPPGTKADLNFVFGAGPKLEAVQLVSGDAALKELVQKSAAKIAEAVVFPETAELKLVRHGAVMCSQYRGCDLVFYTSDSNALAGAVNLTRRPDAP